MKYMVNDFSVQADFAKQSQANAVSGRNQKIIVER
jgi:hypothetical protein